MARKRKKGPKQVTYQGVTYSRASGVDTDLIQRFKEKIAREVRGKKGSRRKKRR